MSLLGNEIGAPKLASELGLTRQAIEKLLKGGSSEMGANNNARVARLLGVDPTWLATGEGVPRPTEFQIRWHERTLVEQFRELPAEDQEDVAQLVRSRLELARAHAGKKTADPFSGVSREQAAPVKSGAKYGGLPKEKSDMHAPVMPPKVKRGTK